VYITDYALGIVEAYTPEGEHLVSFGSAQLQSPVDLAISADGLVVVCDQATRLIQIFANP
jgi:hypothetical protein